MAVNNKPPAEYKSGFVAVAGRPNVGKSTLMNALLGQKVAAVSPRPQTTRRRQLGILTLEDAQVIFMDSPGVHKPRHKLGEFMNLEAQQTLEQADVVLLLADASQPPGEEDLLLSVMVARLPSSLPVILGLTKVDLLPPGALPERQAEYQQLVPRAQVCPNSALTGEGLGRLLLAITSALPPGEPFYDSGQVTDLYEREISANLVREAALIHLRDEVPHSIAVRIDEFTERGEKGAYIAATIFVERESQKPILIGQKGAMLKKIGTYARREIETMSGRKIFLDLRVKVNKNWRDNPDALRHLGYTAEGKSGGE
jgi:GTP-binding protein Era